MEKLYLLFFIAIFMPYTAIPAPKDEPNRPPLAAYQLDGKWHVIDYKGREMFPPKDLVGVFSYTGGMLKINLKENGKETWAFMKLNGEIAFKVNCDFLNDFADGRAMTIKYTDESKEDKRFGFIDIHGNQVIPDVYTDATDFANNRAYVHDETRNSFISPDGKIAIRLGANIGYKFSEGLAAVNNSTFKMGYIDTTGKTVIENKFDEAHQFSEGFANVNINGKFGYIRRNGEYAITPQWDFAREFHNGRAFVGGSDLRFRTIWGIIDTTGKMVAPINYNKIHDFSEGLASVKVDTLWGFIDTNIKYQIPAQYFYADSFVNGLAWASIPAENKYGFIDTTGKFVVEIPKSSIVVDLRLNREEY